MVLFLLYTNIEAIPEPGERAQFRFVLMQSELCQWVWEIADTHLQGKVQITTMSSY
jgi:hypothetical protein